MTLRECAKFANENPVCYIATVEGDQPRVRAFALWYADETGFYFHSGAPKAVCAQLRKNPKTEVCFYAPAPMPDPGTMLRVAGNAEFLNDTALKARLLEDRPFLKDMGITGPDDPMLAVFRIASGEAWFWTMANNMREAESERVRF
ncbi:MAG: pyridoxamine 5'-phosphate oxidase family protein [Armatimonadota bacterium]|nr:pyridoxamine 5'-phosphate oxidase family protein [Armatimonadota bacterium]